MKIKTIWTTYPATFDDQVNAALEEGWRLVRREVLQDPHCMDDSALYAELVLPDPEPEPEPEPLHPDPVDALRTVRDFCAGMSLEKCLTTGCPLSPWCHIFTEDGISPSDWKLPEKGAEA